MVFGVMLILLQGGKGFLIVLCGAIGWSEMVGILKIGSIPWISGRYSFSTLYFIGLLLSFVMRLLFIICLYLYLVPSGC